MALLSYSSRATDCMHLKGTIGGFRHIHRYTEPSRPPSHRTQYALSTETQRGPSPPRPCSPPGVEATTELLCLCGFSCLRHFASMETDDAWPFSCTQHRVFEVRPRCGVSALIPFSRPSRTPPCEWTTFRLSGHPPVSDSGSFPPSPPFCPW